MSEVYITNPNTKRAIKVGGAVYRRLLKNGHIVEQPPTQHKTPEPKTPPPSPEEPESEPESESDSDNEFLNYKL